MKRVTKSVTALLLALVLSLTLLPAQALAADTAPAQTTYIGSYVNPAYAGKIGIPRRQSTLSVQTAQITQPKKAGTVYTSEAAAAADLRKQMVSRSEELVVTLRSASDDVETIALNLWNLALDHVEGSGTTGDYLRWQHTGMSGSVEGESLDSGYRYTFTYVPDTRYFDTIWFTTNAQEKALTNYIQNTILPQLSLGGKTTYQKVQAIYNWITANVKYDYSHMNDPTYWPQYTAYAAAVQKKAVCQGYANLFYRLANDAGIDCRIITGKAYNGTQTEDHAWNIVRMEDEKYYCLDATWDAGLKPENYEYFLKGLTSFSRDHRAETDKLNTPYWTQYQSRTSATDYKASSTQLPAPTVTGGNDAQGRPTLKWNAVTGAAKYEVYRARSRSGEYIKYSTVTGTSYTNTSYIENGNTYYYKVRALDANGTAGAWSSIVSVTYRKPAAATVASGKCGDSAAWKLDAEGTLTISGTGRMYDYEWPADRGGTTPPWLANKYRDSIRALRVEQGITYIGRCAFDSCGNLSDVTLPTSLRIIGQCAFNDCTALRSIQLPEGLTTIMEDAFNAAGLVSITFPSTLGELRDGAFMNCEKLQSLRLPEGLTTIGVWAFYCNPNISSIYIPASVTTIGEEAFIYYNNLTTVRYGGSQSQWNAVSVAANAFPDGVRYVYNVN